MTAGPPIYVDQTFLGRTVTGLERITHELFSAEALAPLPLSPVHGGTTLRMIAGQQIGLPLRLLGNRRSLLLAPGFPPSIPAVAVGGHRVVPYIHDCFLIDRPQDLNWRAHLYMAPGFRHALRHCPWLLVNSRATAADVRRHAGDGPEISLYRPRVRDVFAIGTQALSAVAGRIVLPGGRLEILAVGTVEPRKNYAAAARIIAELRLRHGFDAILHVIGRPGWGGESERLASLPGVVLHGYLPADAVRARLAGAHLFLSTSHDEGLGLPLLEAQYAGLQVVAPDKAVFREVLGTSGLFIDPARPQDAAARIAGRVLQPDFPEVAAAAAFDNVARWNREAEGDREAVVRRIAALAGIAL